MPAKTSLFAQPADTKQDHSDLALKHTATAHISVASHHHQPRASPLKRTSISLSAKQASKDDALSRALRSVCKVYATTANPNFALPWQMHGQHKSTATAWIVAPISSRRPLTNAHAVANVVQVQVRKHGLAKKFNAKVLAVGHECDIAMLTVEDDSFWTGNVEALEIADELPAQQESVSVVGYPTGGDNVCVTKGVVSRIDRQQYSHGGTSLLTLQIDAAINSGNSGGPVLLKDKVVGIAFQCLTSGESIGYVIPVPVIQHFLDDLVRHEGRYTGFCALGALWQSLESADHRASLGMPEGLTGIYITGVEPCYPAAKVLRPGDVLTHFNGHTIADDGTFLFEPHHQSRYTQPYHSATDTPTKLITSPHNTPPHTDNTEPTTEVHSLACSPVHSSTVADNSSHTLTGNNAHGAAAPAIGHTQAGHVGQAAQGVEYNKGLTLVLPPASPVGTPPSPHMRALQAISSPLHTPLSPGGLFASGLRQQTARIDFRHLVSMAFNGDECTVNIWRDGQQLTDVRVQLTIPKQLVRVHSHDMKPQYFIFGGLVFTSLSYFYLRAVYGGNWSHKAPVKLCERALAGRLEEEGQEVVILSKVLAWPDINNGYQDLGNIEVLKVAGVPVHNLAHLAYVLTNLHKEAPASGAPYVRLDLQWHKVVVLHAPRCRETLPQILEQNCIPRAHYPADLPTQGLVSLPAPLKEATDKALQAAPARTPSSCL